MSNKKLVFSGVQPTGNLHLGNYLGALKNFVSLQKEMECIYCVVDLHAITTFQKPSELFENVLETTASFLATGINPNKSIIFNQSSVSGHAELAWLPERARPSPSTKRRGTDKINAIATSAVSSLNTPGVLVTVMPFSFAAAKSI